MSLVPSLLQAIVHLDGEALVMHAGDKPYVVSPSGQVDLATRGLALDAINGIVNHLLPIESQHALDEFGAVQYELPARSEFPGELFTVVAARGGDDIWVEVRRRRVPDEDRIPEEFFPPPDEAAKAQPYPVYASAASREFTHQAEPLPDSLELDAPGAAQMVADATLDAPEPVVEAAKREKQTPSEPATQVPIAVARKPLESFEPPAPVLEPIAVKTPLVERSQHRYPSRTPRHSWWRKSVHRLRKKRQAPSRQHRLSSRKRCRRSR